MSVPRGGTLDHGSAEPVARLKFLRRNAGTGGGADHQPPRTRHTVSLSHSGATGAGAGLEQRKPVRNRVPDVGGVQPKVESTRSRTAQVNATQGPANVQLRLLAAAVSKMHIRQR